MTLSLEKDLITILEAQLVHRWGPASLLAGDSRRLAGWSTLTRLQSGPGQLVGGVVGNWLAGPTPNWGRGANWGQGQHREVL